MRTVCRRVKLPARPRVGLGMARLRRDEVTALVVASMGVAEG